MNLHHGCEDTGTRSPTVVVLGGWPRSALVRSGTSVEQRNDMSIINALHMLLGAGLVAFGVLAHAAATLMLKNQRAAKVDRDNSWEGDWEWRPSARHAGQPVQARSAVHRKTENKAVGTPATGSRVPAVLDLSPSVIRQPIPVIPRKPQRDRRPITGEVALAATDIDAAMAKEVTLALISNGYDKVTARAAVEQVSKSDRGSLETWMVAALRACNRGARGIA